MKRWTELRYVLEVARSGTLRQAAERLQVNETTVARRIAVLEDSLNVKLFERVDGRWQPTAAGDIAIGHAERIEDAAAAIEAEISGRDQALGGMVRLTALPFLIDSVLTPALPSLLGPVPDLHIELVGSTSNLNLSRREADLALRLARPVDENVVARKIGEIGFAIYERHDGVGSRYWLAYDDSMSHLPEARFAAAFFGNTQPRGRFTSAAALLSGVLAGLGAAVLPCVIGDNEPRVRRISGTDAAVVRELWLLLHPQLRSAPRVRAVIHWLDAVLKAQADRLRGSSTTAAARRIDDVMRAG